MTGSTIVSWSGPISKVPTLKGSATLIWAEMGVAIARESETRSASRLLISYLVVRWANGMGESVRPGVFMSIESEPRPGTSTLNLPLTTGYFPRCERRMRPINADPGVQDSGAWNLVFVAWLLASLSTLGALFFGEVMKLPPCSLCWYQRIFMFPMALILPFALFPFDRN